MDIKKITSDYHNASKSEKKRNSGKIKKRTTESYKICLYFIWSWLKSAEMFIFAEKKDETYANHKLSVLPFGRFSEERSQ
ncbi:MAG: hypothetical protein LBG15_01360, partial [Dysgonamonadaceae bacterium]|nr:hypothetical protein [Dysgonamonadaceae bacterium]